MISIELRYTSVSGEWWCIMCETKYNIERIEDPLDGEGKFGVTCNCPEREYPASNPLKFKGGEIAVVLQG